MTETLAQDQQHAAPSTAATPDLLVALDGFEGPIDLLLNLAKEQKVDMSRLAILPLAEQYLAFIASARQLRLEIAADYLVMAAWLAFLKSRLLLPEQTQEDPNPVDMAEALKFQLIRLEAMQKASQNLHALPQLGSEIFVRGAPEEVEVEEKPIYFLPLQDLLSALAAPLRRRKPDTYKVAPTRLYSMEESARRLRDMLGVMPSWTSLLQFMPHDAGLPLERRSAIASTFAATLELVKNGEMEIRQDGTFAPIYMRKRETPMPTDETQITEETSVS